MPVLGNYEDKFEYIKIKTLEGNLRILLRIHGDPGLLSPWNVQLLDLGVVSLSSTLGIEIT